MWDRISYFDKVCRGTRVYNFKTEGGDVDLSDGHARMQQLQEVLSGDEQCVRIQGEVFDQQYVMSKILADHKAFSTRLLWFIYTRL